VSEASGHLNIIIFNKSGLTESVRVRTIEQEAKAGKDFEMVDKIIEFKAG